MILHYNCLNHYNNYYNDLEWINIPVNKNFVCIVPKEYHEIWISFAIQYTTDPIEPFLGKDLHIGDGSGNTLSHIYTGSYYFDENNRVTWAIQYDPVTRTISVPDTWINARYHGAKFTPAKNMLVWGRKFK